MKFNESAVEEWAKEFAKAETNFPSLDFRYLMFVQMLKTISEHINEQEELKDEISNTDTWGGRVIRRIKARGFSYNITTAALYLIDSVIKNWGDVAMYVAYLQYVAVKKSIKTFDVKDLLANDVFPDAKFPTDSERERLWNLQKIDREDRERLELIIDNTLDYSICYKSLFGTDSDGE